MSDISGTTNITDILRKKWFGDWDPNQALYSGSSMVGPSVSMGTTPTTSTQPATALPATALPATTPTNATKTSVSDGGRSIQGSTTSAAPTGLDQYGDYDPDYESAINSLTAQQNQAQSAYTQGLNQLQGQYDVPLSQMSANRQDDLDRLSAQMAQQGILRSSNNLVGQGRLENAYQGQFGQIAQQIQQAQQGLENQRTSVLQQVLGGRSQAETSHAQFLAQKEQQRAQLIAQQAAAAEAQRRQDELNAQIQQQAQAAADAYQQSITPQPTPTGQLAPPPPVNWTAYNTPTPPPSTPQINWQAADQAPVAPSPWNQAPAGWYDDINRQLWW